MKFRVSLCLGLALVLGACAMQNRPAPVTRLGAGSAGTIRVHGGDTLSRIAQRYDIDYHALAAINHLRPPYRIYAGETLMLPGRRRPAATRYWAASRQSQPQPAPSSAPEEAARPTRLAEASPPPPPRLAPAPPERHDIDSPEVPPLDHPLGPPPEPVRTASVAPPPSRRPAPPAHAESEPAAKAEPVASRPASPPPARLVASRHGFVWPVEGRVIEGFGPGAHGTRNDGINIAARRGTPVLAAADGVVVYVGNQVRGYGNLVLLKHDDGYLTAYAHNAVLLVHKGERVSRGQPIARVGETGGVGEPQLHFEIREGTKPLDPMQLLPQTEQISDAD